MLRCEICSSVFERKSDMDIHKALVHEIASDLTCEKCGKEFNRLYNKKRHTSICGNLYECQKCNHAFNNNYNMERHEEVCVEGGVPKKVKIEPTKKMLLAMPHNKEGLTAYECAFENRLKSYFIRSNECNDLNCYLDKSKNLIMNIISEAVFEYKSIKMNLVVECNFINVNDEKCDRAFKTSNKEIFEESDVNEILESGFKKLIKEMEEAQLKNSGWSFLAVDGLRLRINKYNPLRGSTFIPLPSEIANKKACINVENNDEKCFMYSILAKFVEKDPQRVQKYKTLISKYNFSCISYPTTLYEIRHFEKINNISVNVYGVTKNNEIYVLKIADEEKNDHRDLLLLNVNNKNHYVYIKNFEKLVKSQKTKYEGSIKICKRCLSHFDSRYGKTKEEKLAEHTIWCSKSKPVQVNMPKAHSFVKFEHVERSLRIPFVIYCDFESILKPVEGCRQNTEEPYTIKYQQHEAMSFCAYLKPSEEVIDFSSKLPKEPYIYRGPDAAKHLLEYLVSIANIISEIYTKKAPMTPLSDEELKLYESAIICYMCDKPFSSDDVKVKDHSHINSKFRAAAHQSCNLRYQNPKFLPVLFHNLSGYDSHFIIKELGYDDKQIDVIPHTEEKYISFAKSINKNFKLRFLDTFRFMPTSLDNLVRSLPVLREIPKFYDSEYLPLLKRKGVFPYDYLTCWDILEVTSLPKQEDFYNSLNMTHVSDDDYVHACTVWNTFGFKNLGEYSDHYLKTDVLLLADVFESFRDITIKTHKLDPCHYFTLPALSWDSMLRFTQIKLELLTDYDQILMIEQGIRGGICQVSHRYSKANNYHMLDEYNPEKESVYITYQDCNNLYGYAMTQFLPHGGFEWISPINFNLENLTPEDEIGYILDVDVEYPTSLHKLHNDLPFLPEVIEINKQNKLVPHLNSRENYVVHYVALIQALNHGVRLKKINRILKFSQSPWLKNYIEHNTELRKVSKNDFEKDLYKLYNNAVYGKTMENIRNRINMRLVSCPKKLEKLISKPEFIDRTIFSESLVAVHLKKKSIVFNKPIYIGMSILDLSKHVMYEYHYDVMLKKYGPERLKLAYMDTDSFIYQIATENIYDDMLKMLKYLDTSDYPKDHQCFSTENKKKLGKFKDETQGQVVTKFIGLRAKMYSIQLRGKVIKKAKGVQNAVVKKCIDFEDYENCLFSNSTLRMPMNQISSKLHIISTMEINKLALSPFDDKRLILKDGVTTRAIGFKEDTEF